MESILSKTHYRRTFHLVVVLILLLALGGRFFVLPYYAPAQSLTFTALIGLLLDNLVVSLFITVFISCFIFWLKPSILKRSAIEVVEPKQINPLLKSAAGSTRSWVYMGSCGRYTRATTFSKLAEAARIEGIGRDITVCILNPKNETLCAAYATYRRSLKSAKSSTTWTQQIVQEEVLATAVTALKYQYSDPLLRIRLFFVDHFSAFRLDISDQYVVVTKEDKEACALRADAGTYFYDSYKDDIRLTERQSTELTCSGKIAFDGPVDEAKLKEVIKRTNLIDDTMLVNLDVPRLLTAINTPEDPY